MSSGPSCMVIQGRGMLYPVQGSTAPERFRLGGRMENLNVDIRGHSGQPILEKIDSVPPNKAQVHYRVPAHDGTDLQLSVIPKTSRVLRYERFYIRSEAATIRWLSGNRGEESAGDRPEQGPKRGSEEVENRAPDGGILRYLPKLVESPVRRTGEEELILTKPAQGTTIASLPYSLCSKCRPVAHFQVGELLYRILRHRSPHSYFGGVPAVIGCGPDFNRPADTSGWGTAHATWSSAFMFLLESALRDSEDVAITIPYEKIRAHVRRFRPALDAVAVPFLVIVDAGEDDNTLISTRGISPFTAAGDAATQSEETQLSHLRRDPATRHRHALEPSPLEPFQIDQKPDTQLEEHNQDDCIGCDQQVLVTGLRSWCKSIFGDPLFASVLCNNSSPDIWDGLVRGNRRSSSSDLDGYLRELARDPYELARRYIYRIYHSIVAIAIEYYRRTSDSDERELPARKRLMEALEALDGLEDSGKPKHSPPSSETPPAKRQKSD